VGPLCPTGENLVHRRGASEVHRCGAVKRRPHAVGGELLAAVFAWCSPEGAPERRQQAMADFGAWVGKAGDALADPGAPLGAAMTVSAEGVHSGAADGPVAGYSVLRADDMESAVSLVCDHPFVGRGGSLTVIEAVAP
jgi:hypothetical protein